MAVDKKADGGSVRYIVLKAIGKVVIERVPDAALRNSLASFGQL
jgi:3-dehydroquinate synthetase